MISDHDLLGVKPEASEDELHQAFRRMVKVWHPDRFTHDPKLQKDAQEKLIELTQAYERLLRPSAEKPRPAAAPASTQRPVHPPVVPYRRERPGGVWFLLLIVVVIAAAALYFSVKNSQSQRVINPEAFSQESIPLEGTGLRRFLLKSQSGKNTYIIEGPRVPLDWEIDELVDSYNKNYPERKKRLGNFTISQSILSADHEVTLLSYRSKD